MRVRARSIRSTKVAYIIKRGTGRERGERERERAYLSACMCAFVCARAFTRVCACVLTTVYSIFIQELMYGVHIVLRNLLIASGVLQAFVHRL